MASALGPGEETFDDFFAEWVRKQRIQPREETFDDFFTEWVRKQEIHIQELQHALKSNMRKSDIQQLVSGVLMHYRAYYDAKFSLTKQNVLKIIDPSWKTPLEKAFMWIGGWRPTMVFRLLFAEVGQLPELLDGVYTLSKASLKLDQLLVINALQLIIQEEEKKLSDRMAMLQQGMADKPLLTIARLEKCGENSERGGGSEDASLEGAVEEKLKAMEAIILDADSLRFRALSETLLMLSPLQAAQYLLAAAQLHKALRNLGKTLEAQKA